MLELAPVYVCSRTMNEPLGASCSGRMKRVTGFREEIVDCPKRGFCSRYLRRGITERTDKLPDKDYGLCKPGNYSHYTSAWFVGGA